MIILSYVLFIISFILSSYCQFSLPTWITSYDVQANRNKIVNGDLCSCMTTSFDTPGASLTFLNAFSQIPHLAYGISGLKGGDQMTIFMYQINLISLTPTSFSFFIQLSGTTKMWNMEIRYIAINREFPHHLNTFDNIPVNYGNGALTNIITAIPNGISAYENFINYTSQAGSIGSIYRYFSQPLTNNKILLFTTTIYLEANNNMNNFDLFIQATPMSIQMYKIFVQVGINSKITRLHFSIMVFDQADIRVGAPNYSMVYNRIQFGNSGGFYNFKSQFIPNFIVGLIEFSNTREISFIEFTFQFIIVSGIHRLNMPISSPYMGNPPITRFNFATVYLKTWICRNNTVLDPNTDICVICPINFCIICYNYYVCTLCNSISGYFLNSFTGLCQLCFVPNCITCATLNTCQICNNPGGYFLDNTSGQCLPCSISNCLTCLTLTICSVCNELQAYFINYLTGQCQLCSIPNCLTCLTIRTCSVCDQNNRYFINSLVGQCQLCTIVGCTTCLTLAVCKTCDRFSNYIKLSDQTCFQCQQSLNLFANPTTETCTLCTLDQCTVCTSLTQCSQCNIDSGYFLNGNGICELCNPLTNRFINSLTLNCQVCSIPNCIKCSQLKTCRVCQQGFILNSLNNICQLCTSITCQQVCGDFIKMWNQQCDDGNYQDRDGCSSSCKIQTDFICQIDKNNSLGNTCFYIGKILIQVIYIQKINYENKIKIMFEYLPKQLRFWKFLDVNRFTEIKSLIPIQNFQIDLNTNGTIALIFQYKGDIQGNSVEINLFPQKSGLITLSRAVSSSLSVKIQPDDNESAQIFQSSVYQKASIVSLLCKIICGLCLLILVIGLISGKMIAIQMIAVVQITYFSLISLKQTNPCFAALSSLNLINGYNSLGNYFLQDRLTVKEVKGIYLLSTFRDNLNIMTLLVIIPIFVSLICWVLWKKLLKDNRRVQKIFKRSLGEYTLTGLLFNAYLISVSFTVHVIYGIKNKQGIISSISLLECIVFLILTVLYFIFIILKPEYFGEYTKKFKVGTVFQKYYSGMLLERFIVGVFQVCMISTSSVLILPIIIFMSLGIFILVKKPYRHNIDNIRVLCNICLTITIQILYLSYRISTIEDKNRSQTFINIPIIICILLLICILYNSTILLYNLYVIYKSRNNRIYEQRQDLQQISKIEKQQIKNNKINFDNISGLNISSERQRTKQNLVSPLRLRYQINHKEIIQQVKGQIKNKQNLLNVPQIQYKNDISYDKQCQQYTAV